MAENTACAGRVAWLRALMAERGYDAAIVRSNADLRWLTGAERTFDDEVAHTAYVTADDLWLHTDSRYYNTFLERLGEDSPWRIDEEPTPHAEWAAERTLKTRSRVVAVEDTATLAFFDDYRAACAKASVEPLTPRMHEDLAALRMVKDAEELALLRRAQEITDDAFDHIRGFVRAGLTEQQVRRELEGFMFDAGADALSFDTIIAAGPNGANPHAQPGATVIREGDLVVMDYGAGYHDYHADMTRTVCVGEPSAEQRRAYDAVRLAHETCAAAVHAGVIGRDVHELAVKIIAEAGYDGCFKHGLGHGVGVQIHERPMLNARYTGELPAGSVVTVEPGVYLPGKFGIRLEDCGVVTEEGFEPFGRSTHELVVVGE